MNYYMYVHVMSTCSFRSDQGKHWRCT